MKYHSDVLILGAGPPVFLNAMEAAKVDTANRGNVNRAWDIWASHASGGAKK